jgi:hypothetical protein
MPGLMKKDSRELIANGSSKNKLEICPPDIQKDKKDIDSSTNPNISDTDHYDYPHTETSSDDTPSDMQDVII